MKISFRPLTGRRRGSEELSTGVPETEDRAEVKAVLSRRTGGPEESYVGGGPGW